MSFQIAGYEEIQDGYKINVDYLDRESNIACSFIEGSRGSEIERKFQIWNGDSMG
jgi:hypothetical protein